MLDAAAITGIFNALFSASHAVIMSGGAEEPVYLPATPDRAAQLRFRQDFAASALHEAAHWCIAGRRRRQLVDFGYDYVPAPRTAAAQRAFERAEAAPQALEQLFAGAAGVPFHPSFDDLEHPDRDRSAYRAALTAARARLLRLGPPPRAALLLEALRHQAQRGPCVAAPVRRPVRRPVRLP